MIRIKITCGCGFVAEDVDAAVEHAERTGHTMSIQGTLTSDAPPREVRSYNRAVNTLVQTRVNEQLWAEYNAREEKERHAR